MLNGKSLSTLGSRYNQHSFAQVPDVKQARSKFDRSHSLKTTYDFDYLVPIFVDEVLPGDTFNLNVSSFCRLSTQTVPVMDNMYIDYFFFFVPNRLVWTNWERLNGAQDDPGDSIDYTVPQCTINDTDGHQVGSLYDYLGIPTDIDDIAVNNLVPRAYNLIYNHWFRDQNLVDSVVVDLDDGPDTVTDYTLLKRAKPHDYFTSCLPSPQRGDAVTLPLGTEAPVYGKNMDFDSADDSANRVNILTSLGGSTYNALIQGTTHILGGGSGSGTGALYADLTQATAATLNSFRNAIMTQSLLELDARGGTRYVEIIRAHFNVVSPDFRLQRPEILSAGSTKLVQHPIPQTSESNTTKQGTLAAYSTGTNLGRSIGFSKSFTEHGHVIGLACARSEITYQQGLHKMWSRQTRYDFFWPKLQQLGEQAVLEQELYYQDPATDSDADGTPNNEEVFGYQERYAEYRYAPSRITGEFRSTYTSSLDVWHQSEEFQSRPALNQTFIELNSPIDRSLAVTTQHHIIADYWFDYKCVRPMMVVGVPATLGRF